MVHSSASMSSSVPVQSSTSLLLPTSSAPLTLSGEIGVELVEHRSVQVQSKALENSDLPASRVAGMQDFNGDRRDSTVVWSRPEVLPPFTKVEESPHVADQQRLEENQPTTADATDQNADRSSKTLQPEARELSERLKRLLPLSQKPLTFGQLYYLLLGTLVGHKNRLAPSSNLSDASISKEALISTNLAHFALSQAERVQNRLNAAFLEQCARTARAQRLDVPAAGGAVPLRKALRALLEVGDYRNYEVNHVAHVVMLHGPTPAAFSQVMTKEAFNELIGQKKLWASGECEALLERLCTREGRTWITYEFFVQV